MQYLSGGYYPVVAPDEGAEVWNGKIARDSWSELIGECRTKSLREVARTYGVSHETVRRTLLKVDGLVARSAGWRTSTAPAVEAGGCSCESLPFPVLGL